MGLLFVCVKWRGGSPRVPTGKLLVRSRPVCTVPRSLVNSSIIRSCAVGFCVGSAFQLALPFYSFSLALWPNQTRSFCACFQVPLFGYLRTLNRQATHTEVTSTRSGSARVCIR